MREAVRAVQQPVKYNVLSCETQLRNLVGQGVELIVLVVCSSHKFDRTYGY